MILQTTSLNVLTASRTLTALCALGLLAAGGCALRQGAPGRVAAVQGYADLDALVRSHPGWAGIAQYDLALTRLRNATVRLHVPSEDKTLSLLPAADLPVPPAAPTTDLRSQQKRLDTVTQGQIARLRLRRAQSRTAEVFPLTEAWQREASDEYIKSVQTVLAAYLRRLRLETAAQNPVRLNLTLQIHALQNTIDGWKDSPPPARLLQETRAALAQKQARLARLDKEQTQSVRAAAAARDTELAQAQEARAVYVRTRTQQKLADLQAQDDAQIAAFGARLAQQKKALLNGPSVQTDVAAEGALSAETLPRTLPGALPLPGSVARSEAQLLVAEEQLQKQRARWLAFLYDDTRAAALDTARQQHWQVTFGKTGTGAALTQPLSRLLTAQAWKS